MIYPATEEKYTEFDLNKDGLTDYIVLVSAESKDKNIICIQSLFLLLNQKDEYSIKGYIENVGSCANNDGFITEINFVNDLIVLKKKFKLQDQSIKYKNFEYFIGDFKKLENQTDKTQISNKINENTNKSSSNNLVDSFKVNAKPLPMPSKRYKFDIKTKFAQKLDVSGIKEGTINFMKKTGWAEITEIGEEYSVWIKDVDRTVNNNIVSISYTLELRTAAMFKEGQLIKSFKVNKNYSSLVAKNKTFNNSAELINILGASEYLTKIATIIPGIVMPGIGGIVTTGLVNKMINPIMNNTINNMISGETIDHKAEALMFGVECTAQIQKWILELEGKSY